jgi:hypothetical protein
MGSFELMLIISIVVILGLFIALVFIPTEYKSNKKRKKKRRKVKEEVNFEEKYLLLEKKFGHSERMTASLRKKIEERDKKEEVFDKQLVLEKAKCAKLQEKLKQERGWQEKEEDSSSRRDQQLKEFKSGLKEMQTNYSDAHVKNLKFERELKEQKLKVKTAVEERRNIESAKAKVDTQLKAMRQELAHVQKDFLNLKKEHDDINWIAKSEYDRVDKALKEKEKQVERLSRQVNKNVE